MKHSVGYVQYMAMRYVPWLARFELPHAQQYRNGGYAWVTKQPSVLRPCDVYHITSTEPYMIARVWGRPTDEAFAWY